MKGLHVGALTDQGYIPIWSKTVELLQQGADDEHCPAMPTDPRRKRAGVFFDQSVIQGVVGKGLIHEGETQAQCPRAFF